MDPAATSSSESDVFRETVTLTGYDPDLTTASICGCVREGSGQLIAVLGNTQVTFNQWGVHSQKKYTTTCTLPPPASRMSSIIYTAEPTPSGRPDSVAFTAKGIRGWSATSLSALEISGFPTELEKTVSFDDFF